MVIKKISQIIRFKNIELKFAVYTISIFFIILCIIFGAIYSMTMGLTSTISKDYVELYSFKTAKFLNSNISYDLKLIQEASKDKCIKEWFSNEANEHKKRAAYEQLKTYLRLLKTDNIFFAISESEGEFSFDANTTFEQLQPAAFLSTTNPEDNWYYEVLALKNQYTLNIDKDKFHRRTLLWINHKVTDDHGKVIGIITTGLELSRILQSAFEAYNITSMRGIIIDHEGMVQLDSALTDSQELNALDDSTLSIKELFPFKELHSSIDAHLASINDFFASDSSPKVLALPSHSDYQFAALTPIENTTWSVLTFFNVYSLFSLAELSPLLWPIVTLLLLFVIMVSFLGHKYIFKPLAALVQSLRKDATHDRHMPLNAASNAIYGTERQDELGVLAKNIYNLRQSLASKSEELTLAAQKEEKANEAKSHFLSHMSHEMRTPMHAIIGMAHIAKNLDDIEKINKNFEKIEKASTHLLHIINDVLDMSKMEAGKVSLHLEPFNFKSLLQDMEHIFSPLMKEKGQHFSIHTDEKLPQYLISDEKRLEQVIVHFLSNAHKFTPPSGYIALEVELIEMQEEHCHIKISVRDSGMGVAKEQQEKLFQPFQQANTHIAHTFGGAGLGLSICKKVIELLEGKLFFQSIENIGTSIGFSLTCGLPTADFVATEEQDVAPESVDDLDLCHKTILLVDDIDINREIILTVFEHSGAHFIEAENGQEALHKVSENLDTLDIILMDIHMPILNGFEATKTIRQLAHAKAASIPIIAMTANTFREDVKQCLEAGMNAHVKKPIDIKELLAAIKRCLP